MTTQMWKRMLGAGHVRQAGLMLAITGLLLAGGCSGFYSKGTQPPAVLVEKTTWPHEMSDLSANPDTYFGRLPNGFRYILKENQTPADRVSMHLYIQSGSLAETDDEKGIAHFLEHMLFEGSENFPPGEMVKYFQRIGMQFGPDANAHTGFGQTVYDVLLPRGDSQSISEGLLVLSDYAQGALLDPEQVANETNVILAEKRSRDSAQYRTLQATLDFEMSGSLLPRRLPIGEEHTIRAVDAEKLRSFYDAWYRPERMILVMVGQFDAAEAKRLIEDRFGPMAPRGDPRPLPEFGYFNHSGTRVFYHQEKESGATSVRIGTVAVSPQPKDTAAWRKQDLLSELADRIVQKRLDEMLQSPETLLTSASIGSGYFLQQIRYAEISADSKPENWSKAIAAVEQVLRGALTHGFAASELTRAKKEYGASLERDIQHENTRDSKELARLIMGDLNTWRVFQSPRQRRDLMLPILESITLAQVNQAFIDAWDAPHRLVLVTGNADLTQKSGSPEALILAAHQDSRQVAVAPPVEKEANKFPYLALPAVAGQVAQRSLIADLGIERVEFANGVHLLIKKTDFKENEVQVALSFGSGKISEPQELPGLADLTQIVVNESGFGAMDRIALEDALSGRLADISLQVREDMFVIHGQGVTSELPLLFQLLQAAVSDPGFRSQAHGLALKRLEQRYQSYAHTVEGVMRLKGKAFLAGGDSRLGMPAWQQMQAISLEHIKQWYGPQLAQAPLEIAVVGDIQPDQIVKLAGRYLGSLPIRDSDFNLPTRSGPSFPNGQKLRLNVDTQIPKSLVVVAYPTEDFWDIRRTRRLNLMAEVLSEKLRVHIRENLGAAYSPFAYNRSHRGYPGFGLLQVFLQVDPLQADAMVGEVYGIAEKLAQRGLSEDEFRRALDPTLTQIKDLRQTNAYWLNSVLVGVTRHPEQLTWSRTIVSDYAAITAAEITALAQTYLDNGKSAVVIIRPAGPPGS